MTPRQKQFQHTFRTGLSLPRQKARQMWGVVWMCLGLCTTAAFVEALFFGYASRPLSTSLNHKSSNHKNFKGRVALSARSPDHLQESDRTAGLFAERNPSLLPTFEAGADQWLALSTLAVAKIFPRAVSSPSAGLALPLPRLVYTRLKSAELNSKTSGDQVQLPLIVTRGQFIDLVTNKRPTTLPTRRAREGILVYSVSKTTLDEQELTASLNDVRVAHEHLCRAGKEGWRFKRVTIVTDNEIKSRQCLETFLKSFPNQAVPEEVSLIVLTSNVQFWASASGPTSHFSLQQWHPDWVLNMQSADEEPEVQNRSARQNTKVRAQKLALLAKALTSTSDVKIEVPVKFRPSAKAKKFAHSAHSANPVNSISIESPADVVAASEEDPLVFGNFILLPLHLPLNPVRATRHTLTGSRKGTKPALGQVYSNTRALIVSGFGQSFRFDAELRE